VVPMVKFARDQKGSLTIQALTYVAIFVLILYSSFQLWKVLSIKQSLSAATYQAARFVALNGLLWKGHESDLARQVIEPLVNQELQNNPFVPAGIRATVAVRLSITGPNWCDDRNPSTFRLQVAYPFSVPLPNLGGGSAEEFLMLRQEREGTLLCGQ
jgi:Flp pilus assembly protein TadG